MSSRTVTAVTPGDRPSPTGSLSLTLTVPLAVTLVLVWKAVPQSRWHCGSLSAWPGCPACAIEHH
jgi:hypothetical protein